MSMSKKDFQKIAETIRSEYEKIDRSLQTEAGQDAYILLAQQKFAIERLTSSLGDLFAEVNPRFDQSTFEKAAASRISQ